MTNWILDSEATYHMPPQVNYFISGLLEDKDKYIEVADGHYATPKQKGQVQIRIFDNNRDPFIATLHNVILAPDICHISFSIIMLIDLVCYKC